jgi:hypothetical protein
VLIRLVVIDNDVLVVGIVIIILLLLAAGCLSNERWKRHEGKMRERGRKRDGKEMENGKKKNEGGFCVLLLLFLSGSALFPKKIKQPTVRSRSVCVHACQILRSFSTLFKWSLFFSISF